MKLRKELIENPNGKKIQVTYEPANLPQEEIERQLQAAFDLLFQLIEKQDRTQRKKNTSSL